MSTYKDHYRLPEGGEVGMICTHSWADFTAARLAWLYGDKHAAKRAAKTAADLASWNRLGAGRSAA